MNTKKITTIIVAVATVYFSFWSCKSDNQDDLDHLDHEYIASNLLAMAGNDVFIDPAMLVGEWVIIEFAFTADGKKISTTKVIPPRDIVFGEARKYQIFIYNEPYNEFILSPHLIEQFGLTNLIGPWVFGYDYFYFSKSGNKISYAIDVSPFDINIFYTDEQLEIIHALRNTHSLFVRDNELIIYFTGNKKKNLWWCFKKYAAIKIWHSGQKALFLSYANNNYSSLPRVPKCKYKEKWQKNI